MHVNRSTDGGPAGPPSTLDENDPVSTSTTRTPSPPTVRLPLRVRDPDRSRFPSDLRELNSLAGFPRQPAATRSSPVPPTVARHGSRRARPSSARANEFGIGHQIVVLSDGTLVDGFTPFHGSGWNMKGQEIAVRSPDHGATWTEPITVARPSRVHQRPPRRHPAPDGDIIPELAAGPDRSVYVVWQEATLAASGSAIAFSKSRDGGLTWSAPRRVNSVPTTEAFTPSIEALPDGTLGVTHYDFRFNTPDGGATLPTDYWFLHSHDGGATWAESRVTATSFDMRKPPFARGLFVGDYEGLDQRAAGSWRLLGHPRHRPRQRVRVPAAPSPIAVAPPLTQLSSDASDPTPVGLRAGGRRRDQIPAVAAGTRRIRPRDAFVYADEERLRSRVSARG